MSTIIQIKRGTTTQWTTVNPVLAQGERGWDTTLNKFKIGDGLTAWNALPFDAGGTGSALEVVDESTSLSTAVTKITFAGAGVTATEPVADQVLVTIPGGGATTLTGDVTGSGTGSFATTIAAAAVTLAKMASVATASVFYRKTAGTGPPEVQTLATLKTDLGLTGNNTGDQTITLTGDVTGSGTGSFAATIANAAVTLVKMANMATGSLFYRKTAGVGPPEVQTLATLKTDLGLTGTNSGDVTKNDTATVALTLTGQLLTADVVPNSIGTGQLDAPTDAALALAHAILTKNDTATIAHTLTGQLLSSVVVPDSIGTNELAPAVEAMLDGYVVGPASAVDNDVARFDGTTGKLLKAGLKYQTSQLDTTANALLGQFAYGIGESIVYIDIDFNTLVQSGFYHVSGGSCTNQPASFDITSGGHVFVAANNTNNLVTQIIISNTTSGYVLSFREGSAAALGGFGTWSAWSEAPVSTLSQGSTAMNTSYLKSGFYSVAASTTDAPTTDAGHVIVQRSVASPVTVLQTFFPLNTGASTSAVAMYMRTRNGTVGTWTPWRKLYDSLGQNVNTSPTGQLGFGTGAGGTVTQITSKATSVTLAKPCGNIITTAAALAAGVDVVFTLINSLIAANDTVHVCVAGPSSNYVAEATYVRAGNCDIVLRNRSAGSLSEAVTINFVILKGAIS